jgi:radical S-adenosyl methionine domain-containing protein 2
MRWKLFQVLVLDNENSSACTQRDASDSSVSTSEFNAFVERHRAACEAEGIRVVPEPNEVMRNSYILLDEELRLLNCSSGSKEAGLCVLDVGIEAAIASAGFDPHAFRARDGAYYEQPIAGGQGQVCGSTEIDW